LSTYHWLFPTPQSFYVPPFMQALPESEVRLLQFVAGPKFTGALPHRHGCAWSTQVYGAKTFYVHGEVDHPFCDRPQQAQMVGPHHWLHSMGGTQLGYQHCTLGPGDGIYVPKGWCHATLNAGNSLSYAYDFMSI
jgi:hypothetical protein